MNQSNVLGKNEYFISDLGQLITDPDHPLAAQRVRQPDAQPHPCQPEQDICSGHQGRVFQIALPHCAPSLSCSYLFIGMHAALGNMSGGVGCFFPSFMI